MSATIEQMPGLNRDEIASLAWHIWQQEGCQHGQDQENWIKAEQLLLTATQPGKEPSKNGVAKTNPSLAKELNKVLRR
jgi:hypothetical protein